MRLGNPHKQDEETDTTSGGATILSDVAVTPDLPGNPDVARHASGNKHPGERAAAAVDSLEETVAAAQKENGEIPQVATTVPETLVRAQRADVSELSVDSQGNEDRESARAPWNLGTARES